MTTIYLAVDEDGTEACFNGDPHRVTSDLISGYWNDFDRVELPPGTIEKLTGRKITWEDEPIEYSGERELTKYEAKAMHSALRKSVNIKANGRKKD